MRCVLAILGVFVVMYGAFDIFHKIKVEPMVITASDVTVAASSTAVTFVAEAAPIVPARLAIPSIGINVEVEKVGDTKSGAMATPKTFANVGWYQKGSMPGQPGNAVFDGHVNNALTRAGVFEHLSDLSVGDRIVVLDQTGGTLTFAVTDLVDYTNDTAPLQTIFTAEGPSGLVLITCAGEWDPRAHSYDKRLVVYARLVVH